MDLLRKNDFSVSIIPFESTLNSQLVSPNSESIVDDLHEYVSHIDYNMVTCNVTVSLYACDRVLHFIDDSIASKLVWLKYILHSNDNSYKYVLFDGQAAIKDIMFSSGVSNNESKESNSLIVKLVMKVGEDACKHSVFESIRHHR